MKVLSSCAPLTSVTNGEAESFPLVLEESDAKRHVDREKRRKVPKEGHWYVVSGPRSHLFALRLQAERIPLLHSLRFPVLFASPLLAALLVGGRVWYNTLRNVKEVDYAYGC